MTGLYKVIFDLSVYYILTGFYLKLFLKTAPSPVGFILLCLMAALYLLARYKNASVWCRRGTLILPILALVTLPKLWSMVHILPAWVYMVRCLETEKTGVDYDSFRDKFLFGLRLQLLCLPGLILSNAGPDAALVALPYLLVLLAVGVCCLRCLRQGASGWQGGLWTAGFLIFCMVLTVGGIPKGILHLLSRFYNEVIVWLIQAAASALLLVVSFVVQAIADLSRINPGNKDQIVDMESGTGQALLGIQEELSGVSDGVYWLAVAGYVVLGLAVIAALVWLAIRLLGSLDTGRPPVQVYSQQTQKADATQSPPRLSKPKDPRGRVRYYYALFLRQCKARGMEILPGSTEKELTAQCAPYFPGADPKDLSAIYAPARYRNQQPVTAEQAEAAAAAWSRLRKTKYKRIK